MEITSTIVTRTARQQTEKATFAIEYSTVNGTLQRVQFNIYSMASDAAAEEYRSGLVYGDAQPEEAPLVYALVTKDGVERY